MSHPHDDATNYTWHTCTCCGRDLRDDELGRIACRPCQHRADKQLADLAGPHGLYAALQRALIPGPRRIDGRVSGTRTAPLPLRLEPLSLSARGGVVTILQSWQIDWHETLHWTHPRWHGGLQEQLDQTVQALRNNLDWAASSHPAFPDFATELAELTHACRRQTGDEPERRVTLACPCGATLSVTISTPGARCRSCGTQYARNQVLELPLAARRMAA